jgi:gliding motility-associated-like protein
MKCALSFLTALIFIAGYWTSAKASHIVGGSLQYISRNNQVASGVVSYRIIFKLYMDCIDGDVTAIAQEDSARFGLYDGSSKALLRKVVAQKQSSELVPANFSNECITQYPTVCLMVNTYELILELPDITGGYYFAANNCCRNESILNIRNPSITGASYYTYLPSRDLENNSAVFKNVPPQIICINNPFIYDHAAFDSDGDSLSYEFGSAFVAKTSSGGNGLEVHLTPPPYSPVEYMPGFTAQKPMAGNPLIKIHPTTGLVTGTPNMLGRFVVAVYCHEWRNGVKINTIIREFQFVVTDCSKAVVADIPQYSEEFNTYIVECESFTVQFDNRSTGGFAYSWDFGIPDANYDTSDAWQPTFTYPDTGIYVVKLVVNRGSTCPDSISRLVKVYPVFHGEFNYDGLHCPNSLIRFRDSSFGTSKIAYEWFWNFGDSITSTERNPVHSYAHGGDYPVTLVAKNQRGCIDTAVEVVFIEDFKPFAGNDTIIVKGETINFQARGGGTYNWTPANNLSDPLSGRAVGYYPDTGRFSYNVHIVSPYQCEGDDSVKVWVVGQQAIFVPSAFSPNGDGRNDLLRPIGIGFRNINYFRVFNRWGQQMFYTTQFEEGWNGLWGGTPQDIGTYFWLLNMTDRFGNEQLVKGDAILLR